MAKGRLPDGYRGVDLIIKEFRIKNPKGKVETTPVLMGDGYVIITAKITTDEGAIGSGMADADVQEDKSVEKAESGAIRRALLTLGYESIRQDDDDSTDDGEADKKKEQEPREERKFAKRDTRSDSAKARDEEDKEEESEKETKEEKPKSRFGGKAEKKDEVEEEGESKFKRGSRFQRN